MQFSISKEEEKVLNFWKKNNIFKKSLEKNKKKSAFAFYEGPPYANGRPGIHHVVARSFKDIILRYKTMTGFYIRRKAGWDTHGLPAEIAAEKVLGVKNKKEIEKIGVERFVEICKDNVFTYKKEWEEFTERIGYWLDMENPYITCSNEYIESLFFVIKKFYERRLLYKENKVVPWCPRCQTTLASHELAQGYQKIKENSIYVKFKVKPGQKIGSNKVDDNTYLLAWTTTPWTLPGNVALAINPDEDYLLIEVEASESSYVKKGESLILMDGNPRRKLFGNYVPLGGSDLEGPYGLDVPDGKKVLVLIKQIKGNKLISLEYEPFYSQKIESQYKDKIWKIYPADFVSTEEGTGIVHIAPAFGEDDFNLGKKNNLPTLLTVNEEGKMKKGVIGQGKFVKEADKEIIEDLKKRKILFKEEGYEHDYPFCWRCDTPILYYLHPSWFIATTKIKKKLISNNKKVKWHPEYFKYGRFGNFLEEVRDWNFSRERYWGTPLPVWECEKCNKIKVIGSREDILKQKFSSNRYFLLRHGLAETNVKQILSSDPRKKYSLTKEGREQVVFAAKKLKELLKGEKLDVIFSSDIFRCKETAEIIKKEINFKGKINLRKELREIGLGEWEGRTMEELKKYLSKNLENYLSKGLKGGESWNDFKKRVLNFIDEVEKKYKNKKILIVSHGDILWSLDSAMKGLSNKETLESIKNKRGHFDKGELREVEYKKFPYNQEGELDFHRPYIDEVIFECEKCGGKMKRVKEVCDVWFDSGAMPFAQDYWPFNQNKNLKSPKAKNKKIVPPEFFPADFICEGIDQTRGWFYTLLAVSSLLDFSSPYKEVLSTGLVMDKTGKKMSKSRGNVVNPWEMAEKYGADSLRWYFYTINQPWDVKNFNELDLKKCFNRFILTLWNCFIFYKTYCGRIKTYGQKTKSQKLLDKWIVSRLQSLTLNTSKNLENYKVVSAAREIEDFVINDLSNWYIRRSRERFQKPKNKKELDGAARTLGFVLLELSKILAPFVPFLSERIYKEFNKKKNHSVHLEGFPSEEKGGKINKKLESEMASLREIVSFGLAKRKEAGIKVRQPLASLQILASKRKIPKELLDLVKEEVNVKKIIFGNKLKIDTKITKELKEEGLLRDIIRTIQDMRKKAGLKKENKIEINYTGNPEICKILEKNKKFIISETIAKDILEIKKPPYKKEGSIEINKKKLWFGIKTK